MSDDPEVTADGPDFPTYEDGQLAVVEHVHDESAGYYRIVIGRELIKLDGEGSEVVGYTEARDYVFDHDDDRWFVDGQRRDDADVASEQREIIRRKLAEDEQAVDAPEPPRALPGAGEKL